MQPTAQLPSSSYRVVKQWKNPGVPSDSGKGKDPFEKQPIQGTHFEKIVLEFPQFYSLLYSHISGKLWLLVLALAA